MSRVQGEPLGTRPVTQAQEDAIAAALSRLHNAIPPSVLGTVGLTRAYNSHANNPADSLSTITSFDVFVSVVTP